MMSKKKGQRLRRPCKRCNNYFIPSARVCWVCNKCRNKSYKKNRKEKK